MTDAEDRGAINPRALSVADAARLLTKASGVLVREATLQEDIDAGAPTNADGTLNLVQYAAWLVRDRARANDGD
ncbi:hypothetical protein [Maioricimonas sp. JC845]|uniref:hypothetical protein n=1 Tax=Maioricimonas sp. JC845 TaxID=3232138 RepID=UPI00345989F0